MEKRVIFASVALAALTLASCGGNKKADSTSEEPIVSEVQLSEKIKTDIVGLWGNVHDSGNTVFGNIQELSEKAKKVGATFYMPLAMADKAQTQEQKAALIGCYVADMNCNRFAYAKESKEIMPVITKLCVDLNIKDYSTYNWEEGAKMSKEEALNLKTEESLKVFKEALESNTADKSVMIMVYTLMETSLNSIALYEARTGKPADEIQIIEDLKATDSFRNDVLDLVTIMLPYYPSLELLAPTINKMKAIKEAKTEEDWMGAVLEYFAFMKETRAKLETSLM
ncbi:MAG: hypothetical protein ACRCZY_11425 [Phocaeicola sp.]